MHANGTISSPYAFSQTSDRRLKMDIEPIENSLEKILAINGVSYHWIDKRIYGPNKQLGVIAQEVEAVFPEAVNTSKSGYKSVGYTALIGPIIEGIKEFFNKWFDDSKELHRDIASIKVENAQLKSKLETVNATKDQEIAKLKQDNAAIKARLDRIEKILLKK
jgi:hypothetical protein